MRSILKQMYEGILDPMVKVDPPSAEYWKLWDEIEKKVKYLKCKLPVEDIPQMEEYEDLLDQAYNMDICEGFSRGFCVGAQLFGEVF